MDIKLTDEQQKFMNSIFERLDFLNDDEMTPYQHFTINGPAGTGKTVLANAVKGKMSDLGIDPVLLAPTNAAANLIRGLTIHSYFKILPIDPDAPIVEYDIDSIMKEMVKRKEEAPPKVIIIDEVSMVSDEILHMICLYCHYNRILLICIGDSAQLPPVSQSQISKCFYGDEYEQLYLTKIVRQASDSSIPIFASQARQYEDIVNFRQMETAQKQAVRRGMKDDIAFVRGWDETISSVWHKDAVIVAHSNDQVQSANTIIHYHNFPKAQDLFIVGEQVISKDVITIKGYDKEYDRDVIVKYYPVGTMFKILSAKPKYMNLRDIDNNLHKVKTTFVKLVCVDDKYSQEHELETYILHYSDYVIGKKLRLDYYKAMKRTKTPEEYNYIKHRFMNSNIPELKTFYHEYASTIHLAQGRTHDETILLSTSMFFTLNTYNTLMSKAESLHESSAPEEELNATLDEAQATLELYNKLAYVAMTRPRHKLTIMEYSSKRMKEELEKYHFSIKFEAPSMLHKLQSEKEFTEFMKKFSKKKKQ